MKSFKIFWVFLVLVFALAIFAGCKDNPTPTPDPDNGNQGGEQGGENTGDHTHTWSGWSITTNPTCTEEGVETRTCECGDSETRKVDKIDHDYQLVKLVPATATTKGIQEHYECSMCHKLFNANKQEVTSSSLEFDGVSGTYVYSPVLGVLNAYGDIQIYDGTVAVDKGDIAGYVFGINDQGKIIYASYYGDGYGGPSDGFYHDGAYQLTIGAVCGIFDVSAAFQAWPATTTVNGEQVNAWTLYDVVAPNGGYLISVKRGAADEFIKALTGVTELAEEGNTLFEDTLVDGALNNVVFTITKGIKNAAFTVTTSSNPEDVKLTGARVTGAAETNLTKNASTGKYEATFTLSTIWTSVNFDLVYSDGTAKRLTVNNATINGNAVSNVKLEGAPYDVRLYADEDEQITSGTFFYSLDKATTYDVTYDPENNTLTINVHVADQPAGTTTCVRVTGSAEAEFALNTTTGKYEGRFTLTAIWQNIFFDLVYADGSTYRLTYANTAFSGSGVLSEQSSAPWTAALYSEGAGAVAEGNFWYSIDKETTYTVSYDPENSTMVIEVYVPEAAVTEDSFVLDGTTKIAIADGVTIYDSASQNITFGEYTIAVDGNGKIIFASRTSSGYGGPGDGFYHDGTYQVVVGQVCGIFYIQEGFKSWNDCSAAERAQDVKPWSLYTRVCPENYHIITGSQSAMSNLIKAICNISTFNETSNALFESTIEDGSLTVAITFEFK